MTEAAFNRAGADDAPLLIEMMREFYEHEGLRFDEAGARAALAGLLGDESRGLAWLVALGGATVGYAVLTFGYSLEFKGRDAFLDELYLRESARGQGVGPLALRFLEETCRSLGVGALHLEVERANAHAQAVYRKAGFRDHDRYLMTKWLGP
jgi:diamine N-acetyltransferase